MKVVVKTCMLVLLVSSFQEYPFLGASQDAAVYDPSVPDPFRLAEVKCPFSVRDVAPTEACLKENFFAH